MLCFSLIPFIIQTLNTKTFNFQTFNIQPLTFRLSNFSFEGFNFKIQGRLLSASPNITAPSQSPYHLQISFYCQWIFTFLCLAL